MRYESGKKGRGWYEDGWVAYRPMYNIHQHHKTKSTYMPVEITFPKWETWYRKFLAFFRVGSFPVYQNVRAVSSYLYKSDGMGYGSTKREAYVDLKKKCMTSCKSI
jgi:hypothetical protein